MPSISRRTFLTELAAGIAVAPWVTSGLRARLHALEASWRDQEQQKFVEAFEYTAKALGTFLEASQQHVQFLGKKAGLIEDYLKQR